MTFHIAQGAADYLKRNPWRWALIGWIAVIFLSSTAIAGQWADRSFDYLLTLISLNSAPPERWYEVIYTLAEKGLHLVLFMSLAVLLWKAVPAHARKALVIVGGGAVIGSSSELIQCFFRGRDPGFGDVAINVGGTVLGLIVAQALRRNADHHFVGVDQP
jgi:VanZ family protein